MRLSALLPTLLGITITSATMSAQQTMICETTTITRTEYYSNGIIIIRTESVSVCWPAPQ